jgi:hypothetical protein
MNKQFNNKNQMINSVDKVCTTYRAAWETNVAFTEAYGNLKQISNDITVTQTESNASTIGVTTDKNVLHDLVCEETFLIASGIFAYASRTNNFILRDKVNYTEPELAATRQSELARISREVLSQAQQNLPALEPYGITSTETEAFRDLVARYEVAIPETRAVVSARMAAAEKLASLFNQADDLLKNQLDRLVEPMRRTAPEFYNTYQNARNVVKYGVRHEKAGNTADGKTEGK